MRFSVCLAALLLVAPAFAGETSWQEIAPDVRARLVSTDAVRADGTMLVGLELDMPQDTRTYWRIPGETGIATEIDLSDSTGVAGHEILWPFPTIDTSTGYLDYAYFGPVVLPVAVSVDANAPMTLELHATMGICSDICVPAMVSFSLPLTTAKPDAGNSIRLNQALATAPIAWEGPQDAIGKVRFDAAANGLDVELLYPDLDADSLIADTGDPGVLFGTPQKSPDGRSVFLPLLGGSSGEGLEGQPVRITFMTGMGPYEIWRDAASTGSGN